jgi:hypothetical protein
MNAPREFTVEEANALVPTLHRLVSRQMLLQSEIGDKLRILHESTGSLPREMVSRPEDPDDIRALKEEIAGLLRRFEEGWEEVQHLGCVVKDPRTGLVDFYGRVDGELVFLCWRFGEEAITHYHGLEEGFPGRKPLSYASRHRLLS